jgi:tetratricopeptide (TPR) repeat protein
MPQGLLGLVLHEEFFALGIGSLGRELKYAGKEESKKYVKNSFYSIHSYSLTLYNQGTGGFRGSHYLVSGICRIYIIARKTGKTMNGQLITIIILGVGIGFLLVFLVKKTVLDKQTAAAANLQDKTRILKAIRAGKEAVEKDPQNAEAHYFLGKAFLADKRDEQAFREYRSVSRLGFEGKSIPEIEFRETIAGLYLKFHEEEEALKEYILLIKRSPENPEYYFQAGKLFSSRKRPNLAE